MDFIRRNIMTVALLLFAIAAAAAEMASALPGDAGTDLAKWALLLAAAGRALVRAVEELTKPPTGDGHLMLEGLLHAERAVEGGLPDVDDADEMPPPPHGCCALEASPDPADAPESAGVRPREV